MRRTIAASLLALATAAAPLTISLTGAVADAPPAVSGRPDLGSTTVAARRADVALSRASAVLSGRASGLRPDATSALTALRISYPHLSASEKRQADRLLARPGGSLKKCGTHVCVHYTTIGANASTRAWAQTTLDTMEGVWSFEVGTLHYRAPAGDGSKGGNSKLDVYLQDLGAQGLYGYCAPENRVAGQKFRAFGYCALDNDYAEFPLPGLPSLQVTAAHEFFHAIQFNYDYGEDPWLMEATATWMEERYADDVNDNRSYLPYGQLKRPGTPLDAFQGGGLAQYGNWIFFERLTDTYGRSAVRSIWNRLDASKGKTDDYSIQGVSKFLASKKTSFATFYAGFAAGNLFPGKTYTEGTQGYPRAPYVSSYALGNNSRNVSRKTYTLAHQTTKSFSFAPNGGLTGSKRLKITINAPDKSSGSAAFVIVQHTNGSLTRKNVPLSGSGAGKAVVGFDPSGVARVTLTLANASTRYTCWKATSYSCQGRPKDNGKAYAFSATTPR